MAAVEPRAEESLPSPQEAIHQAGGGVSGEQRSVKNPRGFVARYGNTIEARIGVVRRDGLDACVYE